MMNKEIQSTVQKPFIFVLMPFGENFDDIYKFGIKDAAESAGAYAERVDKQIFTEDILDRIFSQINKSDVIVADMTGQAANVFYEVGYAHALGKIVLLLTQNADDIPFNLKHRPHIVYAGKIETLRNELTQKLIWAIDESKKQRRQNILTGGINPELIQQKSKDFKGDLDADRCKAWVKEFERPKAEKNLVIYRAGAGWTFEISDVKPGAFVELELVEKKKKKKNATTWGVDPFRAYEATVVEVYKKE